MPQTKDEIAGLLAVAGTQPKHRFGQNFMIDRNLVRVIAAAGEVSPGDFVVEVGPGTGTLTELLLTQGAEVLAVEIDRRLAQLLRERLGGERRFRLIEGDVLTTKHALHTELLSAIEEARSAGRRVKLVANLPYHVASPLVVELLLAGVNLLAFTVQREVAERLRAKAGEEAYGPLSVTCQLLAGVEVLRTLPPQAFWPAPKVESALVRLRRYDRPHGLPTDTRAFAVFVQRLFGQRRKMLRKSLAAWASQPGSMLHSLGIDPAARCESLTPQQLVEVYRAVSGGQAGSAA